MIHQSGLAVIHYCPRCAASIDEDLEPPNAETPGDARQDAKSFSRAQHQIALGLRLGMFGIVVILLASGASEIFGASPNMGLGIGFALLLLASVVIYGRRVNCAECRFSLTTALTASTNWKLFPAIACCPACGAKVPESDDQPTSI